MPDVKTSGDPFARPARCIPPNPERDGYHWVRRYPAPCPVIPLAWTALWHENAANGWGKFSEPDREHRWEYIGPVEPPRLAPTTAEKCPACDGEGQTYMAMDLLARPPKERAEYEAQARSHGKIICCLCNGAGKIETMVEPAAEARALVALRESFIRYCWAMQPQTGDARALKLRDAERRQAEADIVRAVVLLLGPPTNEEMGR